MPPDRVFRDLGYLHPVLRERAQNALLALQRVVPGISAFETYRSPERQNHLYAQGRTRPGAKVTGAKAWRSWHQYGLALDVAVRTADGWSWEFPVEQVKKMFITFGLEPGPPFEAAHFQLTAGLPLVDADRLQREGGTFAVWQRVDELIAAAKKP